MMKYFTIFYLILGKMVKGACLQLGELQDYPEYMQVCICFKFSVCYELKKPNRRLPLLANVCVCMSAFYVILSSIHRQRIVCRWEAILFVFNAIFLRSLHKRFVYP